MSRPVLELATIQKLADHDLDLLWNPERERFVIVQKLNKPVPADGKLIPCLTALQNGAKTCNFQYIGMLETTWFEDDGVTVNHTTPILPNGSNVDRIIRAVEECTIRSDDATKWRELEEQNRSIEQKAEDEWNAYIADVEKEAMELIVREKRTYIPGVRPTSRHLFRTREKAPPVKIYVGG